MGRLVINNAVTVNGAFEAPVPEPDGWLVLDADRNQVSLDQLAAADTSLTQDRHGERAEHVVLIGRRPDECGGFMHRPACAQLLLWQIVPSVILAPAGSTSSW